MAAVGGSSRRSTSLHQRDSAIHSNLAHIVRYEAKDNVVPAPKTTITRGFEKVAFPKMVSWASHRNVIDQYYDVVVVGSSTMLLLAARCFHNIVVA